MTALTAVTSRPRNFLASVPQVFERMPVKATTQVFLGSLLMFSGGAVAPVSGAAVFAGVAMETVLGGATDGAVDCLVCVQGGLDINLTTDTPAITDVGVAATFPEATDDDTVRIETGTAITGTRLGTFLKVLEPGVAGGRVAILFKAGNVY